MATGDFAATEQAWAELRTCLEASSVCDCKDSFEITKPLVEACGKQMPQTMGERMAECSDTQCRFVVPCQGPLLPAARHQGFACSGCQLLWARRT